MKTPGSLLASTLLITVLAALFTGCKTDSTVARLHYPMSTCIVSEEKLGGSMGEPYVYLYKNPKIENDPGRQILFCCKSCVADFEKDPAKYLAKLDAAEARTKK